MEKSFFSAHCSDRYVTVNGSRIRYWQAGDSGPAVILVHGLGASVELWSQNISALAATHRVYCCDLIGCGRSDKPQADYSIEFIAAHLSGFIDAIGERWFTLVGLSMGGGVCLRYTLDHPERVEKLVLVDSAALASAMVTVFRLSTLPVVGELIGRASRRLFASYVRSMVYNPSLVTDEMIDFYYESVKDPDIRRSALSTVRTNCGLSGLRRSVKTTVIDRLHQIKVPTLILWGRQDKLMPIKNAYAAASKIPNCQLVFVDRCGHNPQFEQPEVFNRLVGEFLRSQYSQVG
jgi:4,5:9,10-diseco-3-hydroxy-5,9,17-trioxoandrosta-1(10),2-diene-4-oate hydrolase